MVTCGGGGPPGSRRTRAEDTRRSSRIRKIEADKMRAARGNWRCGVDDLVRQKGIRQQVAKNSMAEEKITKKDAASKEREKKAPVEKVTKKSAARKAATAKKVTKKATAKPKKQKSTAKSVTKAASTSTKETFNGQPKSPKKCSESEQAGGSKGSTTYYGPTEEQLKARARMAEKHPGTIFCS